MSLVVLIAAGRLPPSIDSAELVVALREDALERGVRLGRDVRVVATEESLGPAIGACAGSDVVVVDARAPTAPPAALEEAAAALALDDADAVLGPSWDGGAWLVGARAGALAAHGDVLVALLARAMSAPLDVTMPELGRLRVHAVASAPRLARAKDGPHVARFLRDTPRARPGYPRRTAAVFPREDGPAPEPSDRPWRTLTRRVAYANPWLRIDESLVVTPSGHHTIYGVVTTGPCVGIVPFVDPEHVLLVRQYRYVFDAYTWEIPTGGAHAHEPLEDAARRELEEETAHTAAALVDLGPMVSSKSILSEAPQLFAATGLTAVPPRSGDPTEDVEARLFRFSEALAMARRGEIVDAMSIVGLFRAASTFA